MLFYVFSTYCQLARQLEKALYGHPWSRWRAARTLGATVFFLFILVRANHLSTGFTVCTLMSASFFLQVRFRLSPILRLRIHIKPHCFQYRFSEFGSHIFNLLIISFQSWYSAALFTIVLPHLGVVLNLPIFFAWVWCHFFFCEIQMGQSINWRPAVAAAGTVAVQFESFLNVTPCLTLAALPLQFFVLPDVNKRDRLF